MRAEIVFIAGLLVCIALTLSACTPQKIAELDEHAKEVVVTFTTPQPEPPKMIETFTAAEITKIVNPYFSVQNSTSEIFRVDHAGNFYLYPLTNCDTLDTDANGLLTCGTDADTNFTTTGNMTAGWFLGSFNWTVGDDWNSFDGNVLDFNSSKMTSVYYNATTSNLVAGVLDGGTLDNTRHSDASYDSVTMNFSEAAGSPGLDVRVNFTVDSFNRVVFRYKTSELKGDYPLRQVWDYDNSAWTDYHYVGETTAFSVVTQPVFNNAEHVQNGIVQLRLYKASAGNTNNHYYIDWVAMIKGVGTPSGTEVDPLSYHRNEDMDNTGYTITAGTFIGNVSCKNITGATSDLCTLADTDTNLTEDNVEAYIFDADNTANLDMNNYNITVNTIVMEVDQTNHWIYDNATCIVIKAGTTYLEVCE